MILRHYKAPKQDPARDAGYLRWVRTQACVVCGTFRRVEAAHVGERGLGQKCPDRQSLPLCETHHRMGPHAHHVLGNKFWSYWSLDRHSLIAEYNRAFENKFGSVTDDTAVTGSERGEGTRRLEEGATLPPHFEICSEVSQSEKRRNDDGSFTIRSKRSA